VRRFVKDHALGLFFLIAFLLALAGQSLAGNASANEQRPAQGGSTLSWPEYVTSSGFAVDVAENWQSEFLAVLSMVVLSIYLRQRGSPESKPVGASHEATDVEG
jgi:hypothetical protein